MARALACLVVAVVAGAAVGVLGAPVWGRGVVAIVVCTVAHGPIGGRR